MFLKNKQIGLDILVNMIEW